MSNKSSRIQSNLLEQNCFVRDVTRKVDLSTKLEGDVYVSLDEVPSSNGFNMEPHQYDYPITPDYVNSFADSVDYKNDPLNAINNGVIKQNLGDVASLQELSKLDTVQQKELYAQLKSKFEVKSEVNSEVNSEAKSEVVSEGGNQ